MRYRSIVVLGMMTKMPVPGVVWQTLHYLVGLRRLGYEVTYVEAHGHTPSMFVDGPDDSGSHAAADFLRRTLTPFGLGGRWAFHALHHDGSVLGMSDEELRRTYRSAEVLLNLCGDTRPRDEHVGTGRLTLVVTDPAQLEVELWRGREETRELLDAHVAAFTFAENYGRPGCDLPVSPDYDLIHTRQPVVLDFWAHERAEGDTYTTVANWSQDRVLLESHAWTVRDAAAFGLTPHCYRRYVQGSRGELAVAEDQNVRLRSGWFSDRSATYLASGRPVVTQDTGFGVVLPTGRGLFAVSDLDEAVEALAVIESDYPAARRAAHEVSRAYFDYRVVLPRMLADVGIAGPARRFPAGVVELPEERRNTGEGLSPSLVIAPESRRPLRLPSRTVDALQARGVPPSASAPPGRAHEHARTTSIVIVTHEGLELTRLCLESLLAHTRHPAYEVVVVDNGSRDGTRDYLKAVAARHGSVRLILNPDDEGFPAACNQGARVALGDVIVFLNNDTIVSPGWLTALVRPLADPEIGAVSPVTNRSGTDTEIGGAPVETYGEFLERARKRARGHGDVVRATEMAAFFCLAIRRETWLCVGPLDDGFGIGPFDDDYSLRLRSAGLQLACAEGVLVHHFGEAPARGS